MREGTTAKIDNAIAGGRQRAWDNNPTSNTDWQSGTRACDLYNGYNNSLPILRRLSANIAKQKQKLTKMSRKFSNVMIQEEKLFGQSGQGPSRTFALQRFR